MSFALVSTRRSTMVDVQKIQQENRAQRERLQTLASSLTDEQLTCRLSNGWTVAVTLAHLAFWDERASTLFARLLRDGVAPNSIDPDAVNGPLAVIAESIPPRQTVRMAIEAAEKVDRDVVALPMGVTQQFLLSGRDAVVRRSLHRVFHLTKIERALKTGG